MLNDILEYIEKNKMIFTIIVIFLFIVLSIAYKNNINNFDNFLKFKEYEFYVDQKLLYLKKNHKLFYSYYEIYFEQEYLDCYWYNSYYFLKQFFVESKLKAQVYTT